MKKQCINDPNNINWTKFWQEKLESKEDRGKDWDEAAPKFHKISKKDDYNDVFLKKLILDKDDTVLDLGCGEGSVTLKIAEKVKGVTGVDSSAKMLELLNQRAEKQNIDNIHTIFEPIEDVNYDEIGDYDIVVASRCLNGIVSLDKTLEEMNKIANKYVFFTVFGPDNWKIEREFDEYISKPSKQFPDYNYVFNMLFNMGIYANVERLEIKAFREYENIEEAMNNGKFKLDKLDNNEKEKLKKYLNKILKKNPETGKLYNEKDKADWILFWWKKE